MRSRTASTSSKDCRIPSRTTEMVASLQCAWFCACSAARLCLRDKVCPAPTKMNWRNVNALKWRTKTRRRFLPASFSCASPTIRRHVRVVHFEVRQLLRHLRPRSLLKKLHRLFFLFHRLGWRPLSATLHIDLGIRSEIRWCRYNNSDQSQRRAHCSPSVSPSLRS